MASKYGNQASSSESSRVPACHSSPIHQVLRTAELTNLIIQAVHPLSLPSLALVSRFFFGLSIQTLWDTLPSPIPLLKLLGCIHFANGKWRILDPLRVTWTRYDIYAPCVRHFYALFSSNPLSSADIDLNIFLVLSQNRPCPLFPQLRSIGLRFSTNKSPTSIVPFLSPLLQSVKLRIPRDRIDFVAQLMEVTTTITDLNLSGCVSGHDLECIPQFHHLQRLTIIFSRAASPIEHEGQVQALERLALPPSIQALSLNYPPRFERFFLSTRRLISLRFIHILGKLDMVAALLKTTSNLQRVDIESADDVVTTAQVKHCFETLVVTSGSSLLALRFVCNEQPALDKFIEPLYSIPTISFFTFKHRNVSRLHFSDEDVRNVVESWPTLRSFILPHNLQAPPRLTLRALRALSRMKELRQLRIPVANEIAQLPLDRFDPHSGFVKRQIMELFSSTQLGK